MSIIDDFAPYKDGFGLVQPSSQGSGNGVRYTCEYFFALLHELAGDVPEDEEARICQTLKWCEYGEQVGVLFRSPSDRSQEGPDDYVARIAISPYLKDQEAKRFPIRFLIHWDMYAGVFQNDGKLDNPSAWFWRMPHLKVHAKFAANLPVDMFELLQWSVALVQSAMSRGQDNKVLGWYMIRAAAGKSRLGDLLARFWSYKLKRHYKDGGIGQVLSEYFNNKEHPLVKYLWGVFD